MDEKLYLIKDLTNDEVLMSAFTSEDRAIGQAREAGRFSGAVMAVVEWDEKAGLSKIVALVHEVVIFRPTKEGEDG